MWSRWSAATALVAGSLLAVSAPLAAHAEDPVDFGGAYVVDTVGVTSGDEERIIDALDSLYESTGLQLFVVYVDTFTGASDQFEWADVTAIDNGFGTNDLLLAVAVTDRQYALSFDNAVPLTDAQLGDAEGAIESELRDDNWAQAAIAGAESLQASAGGVAEPTEPVSPTEPAESSGGIPILPIVGGAAVVGVGVFIYSRVRNRNKDGSVTAKPEQMSQKQLDTRAGSLLVQLDDSLKTSEQELGFAVAQFGEAATADFASVLASAKAKVAEAFTLRQKLDDSEPETEAQKREFTTRIVQLCEAADAELDSQADAFDALRELEKNAPEALAAVITDAAAARDRVAQAQKSLSGLSGSYALSALEPVSGNVAQATKLLEFADTLAIKAQAAIAAGSPSDAAIAVRSAQSSVGQAQQLCDAIDSLGRDLGEATAKLGALIDDTTQDIASARALPQDAASAALAPTIAAAESALADGAAARDNPLAALGKLAEANLALEKVFTGVRDQQAQIAHARGQLDGALASARAQVHTASEFITTRRGGIQESARTRLSEADRRLQQAAALAATDPVAALVEANQATALGASALELARNDVNRYTSTQNYGSSAWSDGSDGADLGGILGGLLDVLGSGGGSGGSSYRSGGWSGGSSRSSGGSRSSRSGSFGGSSRSSGRSSGGRSSRGGRF